MWMEIPAHAAQVMQRSPVSPALMSVVVKLLCDLCLPAINTVRISLPKLNGTLKEKEKSMCLT
jgi:hypothetical protein